MILLKLASLFNEASKNTPISHVQNHFVHIFKELVHTENRKFYHPNIIKLMLQAFRDAGEGQQKINTKYDVGIFFSKITKQSSPNMLEYKDIQSVADSLIFLVK